MFKDCFDKEIKDGDDVLISIDNIIYAGIVLEISETKIEIVRQVWYGDEEIMVHHTYYNYGYGSNKLSNIYKI